MVYALLSSGLERALNGHVHRYTDQVVCVCSGDSRLRPSDMAKFIA